MTKTPNRYWPVFAGIDGTGDADNSVYSSDFRNSHVNSLSKMPWRGATFYKRGPTIAGNETRRLGEEAAAAVQTFWKNVMAHGEVPRVFLAGYSRGGAAIIHACGELRKMGINVACLALFDAVDRTVTVDIRTIPDNVQLCRHAVRDPKAFSRLEFGNCGTSVANPGKTKYLSKTFFCTHAGMGGTPWLRSDSRTVLESGCIVEPASAREVNARGLAPLITKGTGLSATKVTPEMDVEGSEVVGRWMKPWVLSTMMYQPTSASA